MTEDANIVQFEAATEVPLADDAPVTAGNGRLSLPDQVRSALHRQGVSQAAAAREIDTSASALNQWLQGKYKGDIPALEAKVEIWLAALDRRDETDGSMPEAPRFFRSPSADKIINALTYGQMAGDIVCIYGGPGVGKTVSLRHYQDCNPAVWIATMAPDSAPVVPALEEIAEAVGLRDLGGGGRRIARAIRRKIEGTRGLLIIDEAQHLSVAALEELRSIHDATGVGLALVGNEAVYARLTGGNRASHFAQLFSRIGVRLFVKRPVVGDVKALAAAWGVKGKAELDLLNQMASKPGALRGATKALMLAAMTGGRDAITVTGLRQAWSNLGAQE